MGDRQFRREKWILLGLSFGVVLLFFSGCSATRQNSTPQERPQDVQSALTSVAGSLSGKEMSPQDVQKLEKQLTKDPEAQKAVGAITESMSSGEKNIKYCPVDGKRYSGKFLRCPEHNVELKNLGE